MSAKEDNPSISHRDFETEVTFHSGLISPSSMDDAMFTPQSDFEFSENVLGPVHGQVSEGLAGDQRRQTDSHDSPGLRLFGNNKHLPRTPNSGTQLSTYALEDPAGFQALKRLVAGNSENNAAGPELSSILDGMQTTSKSVDVREDDDKDNNEQQRKLTKRPRRESKASNSDGSTGKGQQSEGKDRSREKNKIAAAKCRAKKRDNMGLIESSHRTLSAEHSLLKRQEQQLRATVAELRTLALDHQSCSCGVHQYNMIEARKLAQGLGGLCASMHAPNVRNQTDDRDTAALGRQQTIRKGSEPVIRNDNSAVMYHGRSNSFTAPGQFSVSAMAPAEYMSMQNPVFGAEQSFFEYDSSLVDHKME